MKKPFPIDIIVSFAKRKAFVFPGSEIYGGFGNSYTYGPYGSLLKKNIKDLWWKFFVEKPKDIIGIDGPILLHPKTWHASGHVEGFNDQMIDCKNCNARLRADHLLEDSLGIDCEGWEEKAIDDKISEEISKIKCPKCGKSDFTAARKFNLMFETQMAKTGEDSKAYLRPETAQAIFTEFKNVVDTTRNRVPFGIAQIGKAFRNEITPGNFIFRVLEFEQMEIEYFLAPPPNFEKFREKYTKECQHIDEWEKEDAEYMNNFFDQWLDRMKAWCEEIGLSTENYVFKEHAPEKLSHYSKRTVDFEYKYPFGTKELYGLAYRTDFDLHQHQKFSGKKLTYRDPKTNEEYVPHVLEPTFGVDRTFLAILCEAYDEETLEGGDSRVVLRLKPALAPVKFAVLPLVKKDGLPEISSEILEKLSNIGYGEYDESGTVGKRYRRQDEIGTPVCITVDYETKEDASVTIRDRDTMTQERVLIENLVEILQKKYFIQ